MRYDDHYDSMASTWTLRDSGEAMSALERLTTTDATALSDFELMAGMLGIRPGAKNASIVDKTLETVDGLQEDYGMDDLLREGVTPEHATRLLSAREFFRRRHRVDGTYRPQICSPGDIYREVRHYCSRNQEHFIVLTLNGAHELIGQNVATVGLVNKTLVHPREVFSDAIARRAVAIAVAHNHPSGTLEPSDDDINVTRRIIAAGDLLGIKVLDHIVFTQAGYFSFLEHGMMDR